MRNNKPLIVVGAGSAGAVIAARVSEDADREVLLLEAGPDYQGQPLPPDLDNGHRNSFWDHDWGYEHRPNSQLRRRYPFPRGRVVGGSSAVNTCIALRGQPADYDEWADRGLPEWSWEQCLPAFRRLETDQNFPQSPWHGDSGPLPIRRNPPEELVPWQRAFLASCQALGLPSCQDSNDPTTTGASPHAMNRTRQGHRISAAEAWLTPAVRARDNLTIRPQALVRRVLFGPGRRVRAVEIEDDRTGAVEVIEAQDVILCAGSLNTPGILLRSGVGPARQVEALGVELVADNPAVGTRLLDHPGCAFFLVPRQDIVGPDDPLIQTVFRYTSEGSPVPNDIQIQPGSMVYTPWIHLPLVSLMCCIGKPRGRGELCWTSAHPRSQPQVRSRLFDHPEDRRTAARAMSLAYDLWRHGPMHQLAQPIWPSRRMIRDEDRFDRWVFGFSDSGYHPCGTVPMGANDDPEAACDGRGRVRGVEGLRVGDASLFPTIPSANTNLPTLMVGERMGQWLRDG